MTFPPPLPYVTPPPSAPSETISLYPALLMGLAMIGMVVSSQSDWIRVEYSDGRSQTLDILEIFQTTLPGEYAFAGIAFGLTFVFFWLRQGFTSRCFAWSAIILGGYVTLTGLGALATVGNMLKELNHEDSFYNYELTVAFFICIPSGILASYAGFQYLQEDRKAHGAP